MPTLSLREYSRHRKAAGLPGGTLEAVRAAISSGRLHACLTADGRITDVALADQEWLANTLADRVPISGPTSVASTSDLQAARTRRELALAGLAEHELDRVHGRYVRVETVRRDLENLFSLIRNRLLGLPSKARQRSSTFTTEQLELLDDLVRESLTETADEIEATAMIERNTTDRSDK